MSLVPGAGGGDTIPPTPSGVQSVTAGDDSIVVGGTASAPTIETGTLDEIASLHPPVAAVDFNSQNINNLGNIKSSGTMTISPESGTYGNLILTSQSGVGVIVEPSAGGFSTVDCVNIYSPTITSGTAFVPNGEVDSELSFNVVASTAGSYKVTYGPFTGAEYTITGGTSLVAGGDDFFCKRIPAGWKVIVTLTSVTISDPRVQSC